MVDHGVEMIVLSGYLRQLGPKTLARFAGRVPLLANMVEGGNTPLSSATELEAMGFGIAIFPGAVVRALAKTLQDFYGSLKANGTTAPFMPRMFDFNGLNGLIGTDGILEAGRGYEYQD